MAQVVVKGTQQVIANIRATQLRVEAGMIGVVSKALKPLRTQIRANINWTCHSLQELAKMGHPYGKKHLNNPHSPYYLVHRQSGKMRNALSSDIGADSNEIRGGVGYTAEAEDLLTSPNARASYVRSVILGSTIGTGGMVERNFLAGSLNETQKRIEPILINGAKKVIFRKK